MTLGDADLNGPKEQEKKIPNNQSLIIPRDTLEKPDAELQMKPMILEGVLRIENFY